MTDVLVVEEDLDIGALVSTVLERAGHRVALVPDREAALDLTTRERFDLVVLDWTNQVPGGIELCDRLRRDRRLDAVPIVMLTARARPDDVARGLAAGADDYITKPFSVRDLTERIDAVLARVRRDLGVTQRASA